MKNGFNHFAQVKSFEAACQVEKLNPKKTIPAFTAGYTPRERKAMIAHAKLVIIVLDGKQMVIEFFIPLEWFKKNL